MSYSHYIFGYGSLICPLSRTATAPTLAKRAATPVKVRHLERLWSVPILSWKMSAVGVRYKTGAECNGVLIPVNGIELEQFDLREGGYDRMPLKEHDVRSLKKDSYSDHPQCYFQNPDKNKKMWVYIQRRPVPVSLEFPVAQSYLDIILRGCLTISEEFAAEFVTTTRGWHPVDFTSNKEYCPGGDDSHGINRVGYWVNDRDTPLYARADSDYSKANETELDDILRRHRPEIAYRRLHSV
jgi:hypothetical protein